MLRKSLTQCNMTSQTNVEQICKTEPNRKIQLPQRVQKKDQKRKMYFDLQYVYNTKIRTIRRDENNSRNSRLKSTNNGNKSSSQEESCFGERGYQLSFLQPGADHITIFCVANDCRCHCDSLNNVTLALKCKILISHGEHFMVLEEKNNLLM